jgi:glutamate synthase (NADPH) large chain
LNFSSILFAPPVPQRVSRRCTKKQEHGLEKNLDLPIIEECRAAIELGRPIERSYAIRNVHRSVGTMLSGEIAKRRGANGLPDNTVRLNFLGSAGQSFGAFLAKGITLTLEGDANDYVGKGLSGGRIVVTPPKSRAFVAHENIIVGNVVLYGATSGEAYFSGMAGERFAVRNSGATAVVEGVGDHGCEYMTNGVVVVIGGCGRNFAAGMSGGIAYVLDDKGDFTSERCNPQSVELEHLVEDDDLALVRSLLLRHEKYTGSERARMLLQDWDKTVERFVKVFPNEYRRALGKPPRKKVYVPLVQQVQPAIAEVQHG